MKNKYHYLSCLSALMLLGKANAEPVTISDPGLESAIRQALMKPVGEITRTDMEELTVLDTSRATRGPTAPVIRSFAGIEAAKNLTSLDLSGIPFEPVWMGDPFPSEWTESRNVATVDLVPLSKLEKLRSLALRQNEFEKLTLPGFKGLETLDLSGNWLTNLAFAESLPNLKTLDLSDNYFTTLQLPAGLSSLKTLRFSWNWVRHPILPADLINLESLAARGNSITNAAFLKFLPNLRALDFSNNDFAGFELLSRMTELRELQLVNVGLTNVVLPPEMINIVRLSLAYNRLTNVDSLDRLPMLRSLDVAGNQLTTLSFSVKDLTELDLSKNRIRDFAFLRDSANLEKLSFSFNYVTSDTDLQFLQNCSHLRELSLGDQPLGTFTLPTNLATLQSLSVPNAQLTSIVLPLEMPNLQTLLLADNKLASVRLPASPSLRELDLWGNQLTNLALPTDLPNLTNIHVGPNQLTEFTLPPTARSVHNLDLSGNRISKLDIAPSRETLVELDLSDNPIESLLFLRDFRSLKTLYLYEIGQERIILPEGLARLNALGLALFCPDKCVPGYLNPTPPNYVGVPASIPFDQLRIGGFPKSDVSILGFWINQLTMSTDHSSLVFRGASGKRVHVQRTTDLRDWETLETFLLNQDGNSSYSATRNGAREFFRIIAAE